MEQSPLPHHCCQCNQEQLRYSHNRQVRNLTNKYMENFLSNIFTTYIFNTASSIDISKWFLSFIRVPVSPWPLMGLHHLWTEPEGSCRMEMCTSSSNPWSDLASIWSRMASLYLAIWETPVLFLRTSLTGVMDSSLEQLLWLEVLPTLGWNLIIRNHDDLKELKTHQLSNPWLEWITRANSTHWDEGMVPICCQRQLSRGEGPEDSRRVTCGCFLSSTISGCDGSSQGLCIARGVWGQHVARGAMQCGVVSLTHCRHWDKPTCVSAFHPPWKQTASSEPSWLLQSTFLLNQWMSFHTLHLRV